MSSQDLLKAYLAGLKTVVLRCVYRHRKSIHSFMGGPTEKLSWYIDEILQPIVQQLKSYLKDAADFINYIFKWH